ncbi:MAG: DUF5665 domain-containing protein [Patescibacteria group bacterium]|nr:DUF5665 domain-containing protein [Patescibacteria group bacterium]
MKQPNIKKPIFKLIKEGFFAGIGWAIGVTVGFAIVSTIIVYSLQLAGGIPFVGKFFARIVESTIINLEHRSTNK